MCVVRRAEPHPPRRPHENIITDRRNSKLLEYARDGLECARRGKLDERLLKRAQDGMPSYECLSVLDNVAKEAHVEA